MDLNSYISGFVDGEGCFSVSVHSNPFTHRHGGWQICPAFHVYQHSDHRLVLDALHSHFGCGYIRPKGPRSTVLTYAVSALRDLETTIVPFFEEQRLLVKDEDFRIFAVIVRER